MLVICVLPNLQHADTLLSSAVLESNVPNRYLPSALADMVSDVHEDMLNQTSKDDDADYVPEYEALVSMLKPEYQEEFNERTGE